MYDILRYDASINLKTFDRNLAEMGRKIEASYASMARTLGNITLPVIQAPTINPPKLPAAKNDAGGGAGVGVAELASSLAPLSSLRIPALDAIAGQITRLSPLFEKMAGAIILQFRRADAATRFPLMRTAVQKLRDFTQSKLDDMSEGAAKWARRFDGLLGGVQFADKLVGQVRRVLSSLTSLDSKISQEAGRGVGPVQVFGSVATTSIRSVEGATNHAAGAFKGFVVQIAAAAGVFGLTYKAVEFFKDGIKGASDYAEALNSSQSILEGNAEAVKRLSDSMAKEFGIGKKATLEPGTSLGGLLKGAGLSGNELDTAVEKLTRRAADFSSNRNVDMDEVGKSFLVQLSGEQSDLMKRVGVDTTETTLKQYALATGIAKAGQEMNNQQKVMARLGIVMSKTSFAQDDLANTIEGPANAYRRFQGQIENLQTSLGSVFLPVVSKALAALNELTAAGSTVFDGDSPGMTSFVAALHETIDTASIFARQWDLALAIIELSYSRFFERLVLKTKDILPALTFDIVNTIAQTFGDKPLRPRKPIKTSIDYDKLIAEKSMGMSEREFRRVGGAPLKPKPPATPRKPDAPVDEEKIKRDTEAAERIKSFVKMFTDKVRTPLEEYKDIVAMGRQAFSEGKLTQDQFKRLDKYATKESGIDKLENPKTEFAAAALVGTSEYATAVNRAIYGAAPKPDEQMRRLSQAQVNELKGIRSDLKRDAAAPKPALKPNGARN